MKQFLQGMTKAELTRYMVDKGFPRFRADQAMDFINRGLPFERWHNLPGAMLEALQEDAVDLAVRIDASFRSRLDGTEKYLFAMTDGHCVEGVLMRYQHGATLCISTQVGCKMGCAFCASTLEGCIRNLSAAEMLGEVLIVNARIAPERVHNIVLMGAGEPLDNYEETVRFLRLVSSPDGLNIGLRHISLSTCGLVPQMEKLMHEGLPVTLSVSLHAPNDAVRKTIMPIARTYSIDKLMEVSRKWVEETGRRIVFEYALIKGVNADPAQARELSRLLRGFQCHVNLIPLNDVQERNLMGVTRREAEAFLQALTDNGISATIRREMGDDIDGACGQLRRRLLKTTQGGA